MGGVITRDSFHDSTAANATKAQREGWGENIEFVEELDDETVTVYDGLCTSLTMVSSVLEPSWEKKVDT